MKADFKQLYLQILNKVAYMDLQNHSLAMGQGQV